MKIFICCSKHIYDKVAPIKSDLERMGHSIVLPNSYADPGKEAEMKLLGTKEHSDWKAEMIRLSVAKIYDNDAIVVLNMEKAGQENYIGGATFLEIYKAFELGKKIFLYNPIPDNLLKDELLGMNPTVIDGDLSLIR